jgi:hypothetical protein
MYSESFLDHLHCSIIAHALRIAPGIDEEDYHDLYLRTVSKELNAAVNTFDHASLDFRCIFSASASDRSFPICERLPPSEEVASDTYVRFIDLRSKLHGRLFFPRGGNKTVGEEVAHSFWESYSASGCTFMHEKDDISHGVTTGDCLRLYNETGGFVTGPVEVRSSWKYSQITPRVYYARGGYVQQASHYIQPIINTIIDEFPEVHRTNRFSPPEQPLADDDVEFIYDYASFTSKLDAVVPFVDGLSQFFNGTIVHLLDPRAGIVPYDLGLLFADYNRICNQYQQFDISRLSISEERIFEHTCGMLGIDGNIFIATLLHGIYLRFIVGLSRSKCVGDDARAHYRTLDGTLSKEDKEYLVWMLEGIGEMNIDKLFAFEFGSDPQSQVYRYVKRPFYRDIDIMIQGLLLTLPSQIPIVGALDSYHTVIPSSTHPCRNVFKQLVRFIDTLYIHRVRIENGDCGETHPILVHLSYLVRLMRELDPEGRYSEFGRSSLRTHYRLPPYDLIGWISYTDWYLETIDYFEEVRFPKYGGSEEEGSCDGRSGSVMIREQSKCRSFLCKLGYMEEEMMYDMASMNTVGIDMFRILMEGNYRPVCKYLIVNDIPVWYTHVQRAL